VVCFLSSHAPTSAHVVPSQTLSFAHPPALPVPQVHAFVVSALLVHAAIHVVPSHVLPLAQSPVAAHEQAFVLTASSVHSPTASHFESELVSQTFPILQSIPQQSQAPVVYP